jgi:nonsense-mediated mRNA decay protein 3
MTKEELIRGMCPECFVKYTRIFKSDPQIEVVTCPKCGSWLIRGEWHPHLDIDEVLELVLMSELKKYLESGVDLTSALIISHEAESPNKLILTTLLELVVDNKKVTYNAKVKANIRYRTCPACIARSSGKYKYTIQIRFTKDFQRKLLEEVRNAILTEAEGRVLNVKEVREGLDVELDDAATARKLLDVLARYYSAKITSSFKQTGYDPHRGKPVGSVVYSARIPVFLENDIVIYRGRIALVKAVNRGRVVLWIPDLDKYESAEVKNYWSGVLKYPKRVEYEEYVVDSVAGERLVLKSPSSGATRVVKSLACKSLKPGDRVQLIVADNSVESVICKEAS